MFAGIAEISGTIVLPFISSENQFIYIWFLMLFPSILVCVFFLTLNFNHKVLYAPSDYKNEDNFVKSLKTATVKEKKEKLKEELDSIQENEIPKTKVVNDAAPDKDNAIKIIKRNNRANILLSEELVLEKLSEEYGPYLKREVRPDWGNNNFVYDGIVFKDSSLKIIEIKYFKNPALNRVTETIRLMKKNMKHFEKSVNIRNITLLLAIVSETKDDLNEKFHHDVKRIKGKTNIPVEIRYYDLESLEKEYNI